jgi:hypothetical protein
MQDTIDTTNHSGLSDLVALIAAADAAGDLLVSSTRMVDALLDARAEVAPGAVTVVDAALSASAHRSVVPVDEALEMVAGISAAHALESEAATTQA